MGLCISCLETEEDKLVNILLTNTNDDLEKIPRFSHDNKIKICRLVNVYDGDTGDIIFVDDNKFVRHRLRINGYDSPEIKQPKNKPEDERIRERKMAYDDKERLVRFTKNKILIVKLHDGEKYGRLLGDLYAFPNYEMRQIVRNKNNENFLNEMINSSENKKYSVSEHMIKKGHAKPYFGGKKENF